MIKMFEINEFILKKAKEMGFGDVVVMGKESNRRQVRFANNEITVAKLWHEKEADLFVEMDKRIAGTTITDMSKENIEETLKALQATLKNMEPKKDYFGIAEGPFEYRDIPETFDGRIVELDEPNQYVERAINKAIEEGAKRVAGVLYTDHDKFYLSTSNGVEAMDEGTGIEISVRAFIGDLESGHGTNSSRMLSKFDPESAGEKAGYIASMARNPEQGPEGKFSVIFDPLAIANLLTYVGFMSSAYAAEAGFSFFINKLNKKVASERVTLRDMGNMPNGYGTRKFDDEGVPTKETLLIDRGIFKTFLLNTSMAKKYGVKSTGNAGMLQPHPWNIILEPGEFEKEEIFSDLKRGIYITNVWYTRFQNYVTGDFSTIPRDGMFLVENGEMKPIRNIRVSDNMLRILENIEALSNQLQHVHWWEVSVPVSTPYVLVKDVGITRATK